MALGGVEARSEVYSRTREGSGRGLGNEGARRDGAAGYAGREDKREGAAPGTHYAWPLADLLSSAHWRSESPGPPSLLLSLEEPPSILTPWPTDALHGVAVAGEAAAVVRESKVTTIHILVCRSVRI